MKQLSAALLCSCHLYVALAGRFFAQGVTNMRRGHRGLNATNSGEDRDGTNSSVVSHRGLNTTNSGADRDGTNSSVVSPCGGRYGNMIYLGWQREFWTFRPCGLKPKAILVTIHCLGCTPGHAWDPYLKDAEKNGFIVIAPVGYNASFNAAPYCCGVAREIGLDDQGFIKSLVTQVDGGRGLPIFATGVSNGGYMASSLAMQFPGWLTGVAAAAGHIYHGLFAGLHGTAAMILWDERDIQIQATGCCRDISKPRCCCGISELGPPQCTSSAEIFIAWKRANGCKATKSDDRPLMGKIRVNGTCESGLGCKYPVESCTFRQWDHNEMVFLFPEVLETKVFNFFLAQLK